MSDIKKYINENMYGFLENNFFREICDEVTFGKVRRMTKDLIECYIKMNEIDIKNVEVICDYDNNIPETIDKNELHLEIKIDNFNAYIVYKFQNTIITWSDNEKY